MKFKRQNYDKGFKFNWKLIYKNLLYNYFVNNKAIERLKEIIMEVEKIKKEYAKRITDRITTYKDLILESFIDFYGEDYRESNR